METTLSPVTTSKQFRLKSPDFWKGLIMGVGTPALYIIQELIPNWPLTPTMKAGLSAIITYLIKNLLTPSAVVVKDPVAVKAVEEGRGEITLSH